MSRRVVVATHNRHKVTELRRILDGLDVALVGAGELGLRDVDETGDTFVANALLKAHAAVEQTGLAAIADDSGLVVDALGGEPGVRSARYAGAHGDDDANLRLVLKRMRGQAVRSARFVCAAAYVDADGGEHVVEGVVEGEIVDPPRGDGGFGYDPIFQPLGHDVTTAEMAPADKDAISHRGRAFRALREVLAGP